MSTKRENNQPKRKKSPAPLYISLMVIAGLALGYFVIPSYQQFVDEAFDVLSSGDRERTRQWVGQYGAWGPVILILGQVLQMFLFVVPTILLMTVSILAYGPWLGSLYAMSGIVLASAVAYFIGLGAGNTFLDKLHGEKIKDKFVKKVEEYGAWLVVAARVNPFLSNDTVSFISGIVRLSFWKFMLATVIATTPLLVLISYLGESPERLKTGMIWISIVGVVAAVGYFVYREFRKRKK